MQGMILPPPPPLTEYEIQRAVRIKRNNEVFFAIKLPELSTRLRNSINKKMKMKKSMTEVRIIIHDRMLVVMVKHR